MNKVLVFGDSHIAQLALANRLQKNTVFDFSFVTAPGPITSKIKFEEHYLYLLENEGGWAEIPGFPNITPEVLNTWYENTKDRFLSVSGCNPIDLRNFSAIVIYGGSFVRDDWWELVNGKIPYTKALLAELLERKITKTNHYIWLQQLAGFSAISSNIFSMLPPLRNELGFSSLDTGIQDLSIFKQTPEDVSFFEIGALYQYLVEKKGGGFIPLPRNLYSDDERATSRHFKSESETDFGHLNAEGGKLVLDNLVEELSNKLII
jgi:hypothetical protein